MQLKHQYFLKKLTLLFGIVGGLRVAQEAFATVTRVASASSPKRTMVIRRSMRGNSPLGVKDGQGLAKHTVCWGDHLLLAATGTGIFGRF